MKDKLIEGKEYHLWQGDIYLGIGKYREGYNGDSFLHNYKHKLFTVYIGIFYEYYILENITYYQRASELLTTK